MFFFELFERVVLLFFTDKCYEKVFIEFEFTDIGCFKYALSKCLGYGILLGSLIIKVPQIMTILKHKSTDGISFIAELLMLVAVIGQMSYGYFKNYAISVYGDSFSLFFQTAVIICLILYYNRQKIRMLLLLSVLILYSILLFTNKLPQEVIYSLNACQLVLSLTSKLIQAYENYSNSSTGKLSAITIWLQFIGCVARIFTSIQETNDYTLILTYVLVSLANGLLIGQLFYYNRMTQKKSNSTKKIN